MASFRLLTDFFPTRALSFTHTCFLCCSMAKELTIPPVTADEWYHSAQKHPVLHSRWKFYLIHTRHKVTVCDVWQCLVKDQQISEVLLMQNCVMLHCLSIIRGGYLLYIYICMYVIYIYNIIFLLICEH